MLLSGGGGEKHIIPSVNLNGIIGGHKLECLLLVEWLHLPLFCIIRYTPVNGLYFVVLCIKISQGPIEVIIQGHFNWSTPGPNYLY